jgi:hypothetical protein
MIEASMNVALAIKVCRSCFIYYLGWGTKMRHYTVRCCTEWCSCGPLDTTLTFLARPLRPFLFSYQCTKTDMYGFFKDLFDLFVQRRSLMTALLKKEKYVHTKKPEPLQSDSCPPTTGQPIYENSTVAMYSVIVP